MFVVSNKPGRNDPCPCGSGKKYKRCCLAIDEAAARERARQQSLFEDGASGDAELEEDLDDDLDEDIAGEEEFFDVEIDEPILDVRAIRRIIYTRGFVRHLSDLYSGRDLRVTEWAAPQIPREVLESIEREGLDALEGEWGDSSLGDPIQVDAIDLETDADVISVEVFNRALCLIHADSDEIRRIHRACETLHAAGAEGHEQSAAPPDSAATETVGQPEDDVEPSSAFDDLSRVLKEHRRQGGLCALCGEAMTRARA